MTTVICVKTGRAYSSDYANRLAAGLRRHGYDGRLVCLTDDAIGLDEQLVEPIEFPHPSYSYWDKLWVFSWEHGVHDRLLAVDLDMVVVGDVTPFLAFDGVGNHGALGGVMATGSRFARPKEINSTLMSIPLGYGRQIWKVYKRYGPLVRWRFVGDSNYIESIIGAPTARWQKMFPGALLSYKRDIMPTGRVPPGAVFISFHGKPNPDEIDHPTISQHWRLPDEHESGQCSTV